MIMLYIIVRTFFCAFALHSVLHFFDLKKNCMLNGALHFIFMLHYTGRGAFGYLQCWLELVIVVINTTPMTKPKFFYGKWKLLFGFWNNKILGSSSRLLYIIYYHENVFINGTYCASQMICYDKRAYNVTSRTLV